ncbi:MAG: FxsA family protein [Planctomycetota bacterium]|jgi:UPF0716 protein FxsA
MLLRLLLLFTLIPLVELVLLLILADNTSWQFTLALVLLTGVAGAALARHEGLRCWRRVQQKLAAGELPGDPLLDGLMILLAGALLVTPGVLTDLLGFGLLLPVFRRVVKRWLIRRFQARIRISSPPDGWPQPTDLPTVKDQIIETHVIDVPPEEPDTKGDS